MKILIGFLFLSGVTLSGCTHGLEPPTAPKVQPGFGGTVYFLSPWPHPPADSAYDMRIVAFYNYPPQNIIGEVLLGQAKVYPAIGGTALPLFVDSLSYVFDIDSSTTFRYVVVAMQYGPNLLSDWKVVGAYGLSHGIGDPDSVVITPDTFVNGINIYVDFKNPPPTPGDTSLTAPK